MTKHLTGGAPEEWRDVPTHSAFEASSWGRVRWKRFRAVMHHGGERWYGGTATYGTLRKRDGRRVVNVSRGGERQFYVHQLVCAAFHGPQPDDKTLVMHADDNPDNNRPENLSWGTSKENNGAEGARAKARERWRSGVHYGVVSKLDPAKVDAVRRRLSEGATQATVAREFGVCRMTINSINTGRRWAAVPPFDGVRLSP